MNRLIKAMFAVERAFTFLAGTALIMMMLVVVVDIVGRTLGLWHILSTVEQTQLYMMLLGFLGLAGCFRHQANVVVDVATHSLPEQLVRRIDSVWAVCTTVILLPLGYAVYQDGLKLHGYGQRSEVLGLSPLVSYTIAALGLVAGAVLSGVIAAKLMTSESAIIQNDRDMDPTE